MRSVVLWLALPVLVCAQGPRGGRGGFPGGFGMQWWDNPVASGLNLTEAQNQQIRGIVREYRGKLIDLRAAEEKAQGDLQDVFNDAPADQRRANEAIDRMGTARGEATKTIAQMSLRMRNVLSTEQWQQLRQRQEERRADKGRMQGLPPVDSKNGPPLDGTRRGRGMDGSGGPPPGAPAPPKPARQ